MCTVPMVTRAVDVCYWDNDEKNTSVRAAETGRYPTAPCGRREVDSRTSLAQGAERLGALWHDAHPIGDEAVARADNRAGQAAVVEAHGLVPDALEVRRPALRLAAGWQPAGCAARCGVGVVSV